MQTKPNSTIAGDFNFREEYFWGQHPWAKLRLHSITWQSEERFPEIALRKLSFERDLGKAAGAFCP